MDTLEKTALFGTPPDWVNEIDISAGATSGRKLGAAAHRRSVKIVDDLDAHAAEIDEDADLSDDGKRKQLARAVRDAAVELDKVAVHRDKLAGELADAQEAARPRVVPNENLTAAIWAKLPEDATAVAMLYGDALALMDFHTLNAIELLPVVHGGRLDADVMDGLRRERLDAEAPEAAKALETAEHTLEVVNGAHEAATAHLEDIGRGLPEDLDAEDGVTGGGDGLRRFSPSAYADALDGANG